MPVAAFFDRTHRLPEALETLDAMSPFMESYAKPWMEVMQRFILQHDPTCSSITQLTGQRLILQQNEVSLHHQSKYQLLYFYTVQDLYSAEKQITHIYKRRSCNRLVVEF